MAVLIRSIGALRSNDLPLSCYAIEKKKATPLRCYARN